MAIKLSDLPPDVRQRILDGLPPDTPLERARRAQERADDTRNTPTQARPRSANSESAIVSAILDYLAYRGIVAARTQAGALHIEGRAIRLLPAGWADITAIAPGGRAWFIEVKTASGKQSEAQRAFQLRVEAAGARYTLARSIDDVQAVLDGEG